MRGGERSGNVILQPGFKSLEVLRKGTRAAVEKVAKTHKKHPATIYRWIESYNCSGHLSELLRKNRADRGKSRLSSKVDTIIEDAIKKIYLTAEQPHQRSY